ncbi:MAG: hypothetical protein GXP33_16255 [Spirochaetes bacterium]|nr:hypothetical protein [Spirochaetota bacterium]
MKENSFNYHIVDSQGTWAEPVEISKFDIEAYADYEVSLSERVKAFRKAGEGVLVHRRFRVPEVYAGGCKDMERSLSLQLGALRESMKFDMDIPNFLEPWYGIGTIAGAFGIDYFWDNGNAPAVKAPFATVGDAINYNVQPVDKTSIGKHTIEMIEYFLDKTGGRVPMSLTDTQSPYNIASYLVETNSFYMALYDSPGKLQKLLSLITELSVDFNKKQAGLIGDALVWPGHGFASHRSFMGIGMSDDNMIMLSPEDYIKFEIPHINRLGEQFGGAAFHSCGNWSLKIDAVKRIKNLKFVDGAFTHETDPDPNPAGPFNSGFANTGIILNVRMVGNAETVVDKVKELRNPGMKCIFVTYLKTPEEQRKVYKKIHGIYLETDGNEH